MPVDADNAYTIAGYMRIASIAIALYDYLETQPTAWRFYREHWQSRRMTISVVLFFLLRFVSILTLTLSSVGFFYGEFTMPICARFYLLPPVFKVVQAMVSQAILGIRAFNLSRRSRSIGYFLLVVYIAACILQWVTNLYQRTPQLIAIGVAGDIAVGHGNCRAFNQVKRLGAWIFYAISIIYDVMTTSMSIWYLLKYKFKTTNSMMSKVTRMMLYDGLGYLFVLTAINILNLILYKTSQEIQTAGASLGYCVSWIMSQRLLIHLYDASRERREDSFDAAAITISKNVTTARDVSRVVRTQFDQKSSTPFDLTRPDLEFEGVEGPESFPEDTGVQVRIERTVRLNQFTRTYELEDYSRRSRSTHLV
ncbi:hypothetical protein B0H34DRAFT_356698 [Crassisporium funariophilum]|nr:hypothetical protein B0H34DRAFT_356698 [Crassisporium funariophilum]